jgi:hypothetical protein
MAVHRCLDLSTAFRTPSLSIEYNNLAAAGSDGRCEPYLIILSCDLTLDTMKYASCNSTDDSWLISLL